MSRSDWNRFYYNQYPKNFCEIISGESSAAGGGSRCLENRSNGADDGDLYGYIYNSSDMQNGTFSLGQRIHTSTNLKNGVNGIIIRLVALPTENQSVSSGNAQCYVFGPSSDHTTKASGNTVDCDLYRVNSGGDDEVLLQDQTVPVIADTYWIQYDLKVMNNESGNVEFYLRYNDGSTGQFSEPSEDNAEWTSYQLIYTDSSVDKITATGYWGFGHLCTSNNSGGTFAYATMYDVVRLGDRQE